jgi:hypothetical protein
MAVRLRLSRSVARIFGLLEQGTSLDAFRQSCELAQ